MLRPFCNSNLFFSARGNFSNVRTLSQSAKLHNSTTIDDDMPVEMENPYAKPLNRCLLCGVKVDYKNVQLLSQFISSFTGMAHSQKHTGLCDKKYEEVMKKIKMARRNGYLAFRTKEISFFVDPVITQSGSKMMNRVSEMAGASSENEEEMSIDVPEEYIRKTKREKGWSFERRRN